MKQISKIFNKLDTPKYLIVFITEPVNQDTIFYTNNHIITRLSFLLKLSLRYN